MTVTVHTKKYLLLAAVLTSLYPGCGAQPPACTDRGIGLQNTAQFKGAPTSFARTDNDKNLLVQWTIIPFDIDNDGLPAINITNFDNMVDPTLTSNYAVNETNLIVLDPIIVPQGSMQHATGGAISVIYQDPYCVSEAGLIVVDKLPTCGCDTSNPSNKKLTCSIQYACFSRQYITPIMTWQDCSGNTLYTDNDWDYYTPVTPDPNNPDDELFTSQYPDTIIDGSAYICQVNFSEPIPDPTNDFVATNAPIFTTSCSAYCPAVPPTTTSCSNQKLVNTVVYVGDSTAFFRANDGQNVQWQVIPSNLLPNRLRSITNCPDILTPEFTNNYQVNGSQLTVLSATVDNKTTNYPSAGLYIMNIQNLKCSTAANLIVIKTPLSCTYNASNPLTLTCSVIYAESTVQPCNAVFIWTDSNGTQKEKQVPFTQQIDPFVKIAQSQLSIKSSDTATYTCQLTYAAPALTPFAYIAPQAPTFSAKCSVARS